MKTDNYDNSDTFNDLDDYNREELEHHLKSILDELSERERKLIELEKEMAAIEYQLSTLRSDRSVRSGIASRIIAAERYRSRLQNDLLRKKRHRVMIKSEVDKVVERRDAILRDLEDISHEGAL